VSGTGFSALKLKLKKYLSGKQIKQVEAAYQLAFDAHAHQYRNSGEPYITHPVAVASILADTHLDAASIMAALMHDVLEDTKVEKTVLTEKFGEEVTELVDGVSKLTQIHFETKAEAQAANFRKMMMAMAKDIRVILIKLADRLHNMRTLGHMPTYKKHRIAKETLEIYAPIANRLGMRAFRDEFHELGFKNHYPLRYLVLENQLNLARGNRKGIVEKITLALQKSLKDAGLKHVNPMGREKNLFSIYRKMRTKHLHFSEILDVYAFRIVVDNVDKCYRALGAVHNSFKPVPERFKDYIAIPKANGYQSLHTTLFGPYGVPIEIQIRTEQMHKMAENGIAAHWLYKAEDSVSTQAQMRAREWIKGVLEIQQSAGNSLEFIENVKIDLFPDEVYVFTPKGHIMELPNGATAVDFAYAVHSDVGNSCVAVKLDRRLVPLSSVLVSGQTIEIITAPGARPNPAWLNFVATGKARGNIRHYLKKQQRKESIDVGKRLLTSALEKISTSLDDIPEENMKGVLSILDMADESELYEHIGLGNQMAAIVAQRLLATDAGGLLEESFEISKSTELALKGTEGLAVHFANCCYPIPGDPVFGILSSGQGIMVHVETCQNVSELREKNQDKCIPVRWEEEVVGDFSVGVAVGLENRRGALATLALAAADAESSIDDIAINEFDGRYATIHLLLSVRDRQHLARVLRRMRQIKYVTKIVRHKQHLFH
jgi:GTP diphosphokinase / guanosine-3',5'-bis(diphosphate) 3'-diphosphatase